MTAIISKQTFLETITDKKNFSYIKNVENITGNIGYGLNNNAARTAGVSIVSICENNKDKKFVFHLLCNDITTENIDKFASIAKKYEVNINMYFLDIKKPIWSKLSTNSNIPLPTWYRMFFPYIITDCNHLLYLDTDVICINDISDIFSLRLGKNIVAVIPDVEPMQSKRTKALNLVEYKYFNAGVMLIDLQNWSEHDIGNKLFTVVDEEKDSLLALDQDALNIVFSKEPHIYMDQKYNSIELWKDKDAKEKLNGIKLIHFASHPKPWSILWQYEKRPYMENIYSYYENISPWNNAPLELPKSYHHKRWYAESLRNDGKILSSLYWYWQYIKGKYGRE